MTGLEQHLTGLMTAHAEHAPNDVGLLSRVQAASTRRTRVRRFGALGLAVAIVAGVALGASVLTRGKPQADRFTDPTGFLVDGRNRVASFPLTPTYLHPRLSERPSLDPYDAEGRYGSATWRFPKVPGTGAPQDTITLLPTPPREFPGATSVVVAGRPGHQSQDCSALVCTLTWQRGPAQFAQVYVTSASGGAKDEAYRVAAGLVDKPVVVRPALVLGLVPGRGCGMQMPRGLDDGSAYTSYFGSNRCAVSAAVEPLDDQAPPPGGKPVVLGGRAGTLREDTLRTQRNGAPVGAPVWLARFPLAEGRVLLVTVPRDSGWNRAELDRFVRAIIVPKRG